MTMLTTDFDQIVFKVTNCFEEAPEQACTNIKTAYNVIYIYIYFNMGDVVIYCILWSKGDLYDNDCH